MRTSLLFVIVVSLAAPAWAQGGFIGVYSDDTGSACNLTDNTTAVCSYYVIHSLSPATRGSRFRIESQHAGIKLGDTPVFLGTTGSSETGVSISYGACTDASEGLHVLTLNYFCQGTTPACATMEVVAGPDGLEAMDCDSPVNWVPATGWTSYINNDGSCPCDLPGNPEIGVSPPALQVALCPPEMSTQTVTISNSGASDLEFTLAVTDTDGVIPLRDVLYFTDITPDSLRVGEKALQNLGITRTLISDYSLFLTSLGHGGWDLVIFEPAPYTPMYPFPSPSPPLLPSPASAFAQHVSAGGAVIASRYYDDEFGRFMQALQVGSANSVECSPWTSHRIFRVPNVVPDTLSWSGYRYAPSLGGIPLAGYTSSPDLMQAAIVLGNNGRTVVNGMTFQYALGYDADTDGKDDIVELMENEIMLMLEPWITATTASGTVAPDSSVDIDVVFNAPRWLTPGAHDAQVRITSNDPARPEVIIAAQLDVPVRPLPGVSPLALTDTIPPDSVSIHSLTLTNGGPCDVAFGIAVRHGWPGTYAASRIQASTIEGVDAAVSAMRARSGIYEGPLRRAGRRFLDGKTVDEMIDRPGGVAETYLPPHTAPGPNVAVLAGGDPGDVHDRLAETLKFQSVTYIDVMLVTPALSELQAFDGVVVWWDYPYQDAVALGNNLADYVDGGGGVLLAVPETAGETGSYLGGRWETGEYFIIDRSDFQTGQATLGTILDAGHPIMAGVDSLDGGAFSFRPSSTALTTDATLVATWSDGMPLVAARHNGGVRRADLGYFLHSGTYGWQSDTDGGVLMANALEWVSGYGERWLSLSATTGNLGAGSGVGIDVVLDATGLDVGSYLADIVVDDNDPDTPVTVIPVELIVGNKVAVLIQSFFARPAGAGIELSWEILTDENILGHRVYRSAGADDDLGLLNTDHLIPASARAYLDEDVEPGQTYRYVLGVVRDDGTELRSPVETASTRSYALELRQNYPNPFNPVTTISFSLPRRAPVNLSLYAADGSKVRTLVDQVLPGGICEAQWDGTDDRGNAVSSGVYFYRLTVGNHSLARKMVYVK